MPWVAIFLKNMAQINCVDRGMILKNFNIFASQTHKLLRKAYMSQSTM